MLHISFHSVEDIYKKNLDELADVLDGDVEAAVKNVRQRAESAVNKLKTGVQTKDKGARHKQLLKSIQVLIKNFLGSNGTGFLMKDFLSERRESLSLENTGSQQSCEEIKVSGKLNKLQVYIDSKIDEIQTLNHQLAIAQQELEIAEKEKENYKNITY